MTWPPAAGAFHQATKAHTTAEGATLHNTAGVEDKQQADSDDDLGAEDRQETSGIPLLGMIK